MAARKRSDVERKDGSESRMTHTEFMRRFPDNDTCLDYLKQRFYPAGTKCSGCGRPTKFHRIRSRAAYGCQFCGHQVYPTAGTIFHKSTTSLHLWFWAIYLMSSTRCGLSAKHLEREIGVSYKTAHRMFKQIRSLLADDDDEPLSGRVEIDETAYGGKPRLADTRRHRLARLPAQAAQKWAAEHKVTVLGMAERGGRIRARVVPDRSRLSLEGTIRRHVLPSSMIFTDEWPAYIAVGRYFRGHRRVHHTALIYVNGDAHTQTIEGFFGLFKNSVRGAHHAISGKYLPDYLNEWAWRWNHRDDERPMSGRSWIRLIVVA